MDYRGRLETRLVKREVEMRLLAGCRAGYLRPVELEQREGGLGQVFEGRIGGGYQD